MDKNHMSNSSLVRPGLTTPYAKKIPEIKQKLLNRIKALNADDVRRERIPFIKALHLELTEQNFPLSAQIFGALMDYEEAMDIPEGLSIMLLSKSKDIMLYIVENLKEMEKFRTKKNQLKQIRKLLEICDYFVNGNKDLYWIADELYQMTLNVVEKDHIVVRNFYDEILYCHGKLLLDQMENSKRACEILDQARSHLLGKSNLPVDEEFLLRKICTVYFRALMLEAKNIRKMNKLKSDEIMSFALIIANESQQGLGIADCYVQKGNFAYEEKNFSEALANYMNAYKNAKLEKNTNVICTLYLKIADAHKELSDFTKSKKYLEMVMEIATAETKIEFIADVYKLLGQIDLKLLNAKSAQNNLVQSVMIYHDLQLKDKLKNVRYIAALAMSQEVIYPIIDTILLSDVAPAGHTNYHFFDLLRWKLRGIRFWDDQESN